MDTPIELYTSSYARFDPATGTCVQISNGHPRWFKHELRFKVKEAYPAWALVKADNTFDDFRAAYLQALDEVGVDTFRSRFRAIVVATEEPRLVLCCFEAVDKPDTWCHRTMFAQWWSAQTGENVIELGPAPAALTPPEATLFD